MSPLRGEKPIFGPLRKNNTGMAGVSEYSFLTAHQHKKAI